ncbi:MAG: zinc ribbon domain-containing protein [Candidatus Margulisbacteria bacterium]|nr:zinc ribbon domain-containing protein [Candidatus Margulisiibacteriota bacterium]MBU1616307.1 zinc ribbon domain-containing protein [Candidatus Margulisiibacteriota bacterium]MBU1867578.1 zinc ribbon domain-containing protein [Candidatus Margulisiibacteriota bacterium]
MSNVIEFVKNYEDTSTDRGFQFEFTCNRCGTGYRTNFESWAPGNVASALQAASSIFGGVFNRAAAIGEQVRSAAWKQAHDGAFAKAINEIKPSFIQCPRCSTWVCRKSCWNEKKGLCKQCAPDLGVEMAAAQASKSVEEVWAHAAMAEEDKKLGTEYWRRNIRATCPKCEAPLASNAKFCPSCGENLQLTACPKCEATLAPGSKFCPECGEKI